jgi:hypothetical protein
MTLASTPDRPHEDHEIGSPSLTDARPKTVLFCACGREAPADAWQREHDDGRRIVGCPDCGETLTVR